MTTFRWYILGLVLLFGVYVAVEYYKPKPLDWRPTLVNTDKIPYGTYAVYDVLPQVLGSDSVEAVRQPIFNQVLGTDEPVPQRPANVEYDAGDSTDAANDEAAATTEAAALPLKPGQASYVFVNQTFECSTLETKALLRFMQAGHDVLIAAERIDNRGTSLADTLGFRLVPADTTLLAAVEPGRLRRDSVRLQLANAPTTYLYGATAADTRIELQSNRPHQGATLATDAQGRPVLVRFDLGAGHLYLCSVPLALGNYWALRPRQGAFAWAVLSQLPAGRPVWWDEYQKQGREGEQSLLRVVMEHPALKTAWYLLLAGGALFVLIEARRRQRIIPTIRPLPNTTLLFTRTVAGLYRQGRTHGQIAEKKVALFLDYLRTRFQEPAPDLGDDSFRERLSQKSGLPRPRVDELLRYLNYARTAPAMTDRELLTLSRAIHDFKRESR